MYTHTHTHTHIHTFTHTASTVSLPPHTTHRRRLLSKSIAENHPPATVLRMNAGSVGSVNPRRAKRTICANVHRRRRSINAKRLLATHITNRRVHFLEFPLFCERCRGGSGGEAVLSPVERPSKRCVWSSRRAPSPPSPSLLPPSPASATPFLSPLLVRPVPSPPW